MLLVLLDGPKRYNLASPVGDMLTRYMTTLNSPDRENYAGKYPREAKVKKCKIPLCLFGKDGEKEEDAKSNVAANDL
jgi:hypothetical protein